MLNLHNHATQAKAFLKAAYDIYWSPPLGLNTPVGWEAGPGYTDGSFKVLFYNLLQEEDLLIHSVKRGIAQRNLHELLVSIQPTTFYQWGEANATSEKLEGFIAETPRVPRAQIIGAGLRLCLCQRRRLLHGGEGDNPGDCHPHQVG